MSVPTDLVLSRVIELASGLAADRSPVAPGPETLLANGGFWLDSLALLELLVACEQTFGVCLDDTELTPSRLRTAGSLAALVDARLATIDGSNGT